MGGTVRKERKKIEREKKRRKIDVDLQLNGEGRHQIFHIKWKEMALRHAAYPECHRYIQQ